MQSPWVWWERGKVAPESMDQHSRHRGTPNPRVAGKEEAVWGAVCIAAN